MTELEPVPGSARPSSPRLVAAVAAEPFDLAGQVPVRARLLAAGPEVHVLVVVIHHIAGDGWSMGLLARDISVAYAARRAGRGAGVGAAAGAVRRLRAVAAGAAGDRGRPGQPAVRARWPTGGRRWPGCREELALPADRPRPAAASHTGPRRAGAIPAQVHRRLAALAPAPRA